MSRIQQDLSKGAHLEIVKDGAEDNKMLRRVIPASRKLRVAVIGAGMAGIRASDLLLQYGVDVTVYEARARVGGRIGQSKHLGHLVDLGPNWIHGTSNNPILDIAHETDTKIHSWEESQAAFDEHGQIVEQEDLSSSSEAFWGILSDAFKYSNDNSEDIPAEMSLLEYVQEQAKHKFEDDLPAVAERRRNLIMREAEMWGGFVGSPTRRQSLKFFWLEECLEGENPFVAGTYKKVLDKVSQPMLNGANVLLEERVTSITYVSDGGKEQVQIVNNHGHKRFFDEVISTLPLGVLKREKDIFHPKLPTRLSQAIDAIGYGSLDKVYITFEHAWWDEITTAKTNTASVIAPNVTATTKPLHQTPSKEDGAQATGFLNWYHPKYSKKTNPECWTQSAINLAALSQGCAQPTLLYYIFGDCAKHIAHIATTGPLEEREAAVIDFFRPYFSLLPNYEGQQPVATLATCWTNDEFAGYGSYSNFQIGLTEGDKDLECMREGMPERHIWFAGEHTAPFVALGTVTGAYWSGEGVARRIIKAYGLNRR